MRNAMWATLALIAAAGLGLAQEKKAPPAPNGQAQAGILHVRFADLDANKDGKITKGELEAYFARLDRETDGGISQAEFNAAAAAAPGCGAARPAGEPKKK